MPSDFLSIPKEKSGVGPQQLIDMERIIAKSALWNRPILSFSRAKRPFFSDTYGQSKTTFYSGVHLAYPC
jgi:hypothetical protein